MRGAKSIEQSAQGPEVIPRTIGIEVCTGRLGAEQVPTELRLRGEPGHPVGWGARTRSRLSPASDFVPVWSSRYR